jgi:hypothetical protein
MKPVVLDHWMHDDGQPSFGIKIYNDNNRYIDEISFVRLTNVSGSKGGENTLREGRFRNYVEQDLLNHVNIMKKNVDRDSLVEWFDSALTWIAYNIHDEWALDVEYYDINKIEFKFGFTDTVAAVYFRLMFNSSDWINQNDSTAS